MGVLSPPGIIKMNRYEQFIKEKSQLTDGVGFKPLFMPEYLFDFQKSLVEWAIEKGRCALFADCGMGKTPMQLVWAENVLRKTNKPVLILTPLAVSFQTLREGEKFDIECKRSNNGKAHKCITITNYEQLHKFEWNDFSGVVCDESSILKNFSGTRKQEITDFMKKIPYRLLATATAAPNDFIELGTSSEALGYMGYIDMLDAFFKNDNNNVSLKRMYGEVPKWRFRGHAEIPFWRWVTSWARACRKPSDLGFEDDDFILPELIETKHLIINIKPSNGTLFNLPAVRLDEQRAEVKRTIRERCEKVAELARDNRKALVMCHLNDEGKQLKNIISGSVEISGSDSDERKEDKFMSFINGGARVLITKPKIGAWGLNFQHCNHVIYFPSHSYEAYYQSVRRCWRFGQKKKVFVDIVLTEGEERIMSNLLRKEKQAFKMFDNLVNEMNNFISREKTNKFTEKEEMPAWL